ncbi:SMP-30/Gluconolaconase/LRE-like region [Aspergillus luchuensis]|uniref:SMP-30/Gluconolaconase/LRE-like region n=1 Tax=Aspergillus kawachii TaxID=1069201 RepID=A0A146FN95_ASPKA|nr:SMP-30/Gluconolaconase/LRE-like region [Aspergillus luchuensis]
MVDGSLGERRAQLQQANGYVSQAQASLAAPAYEHSYDLRDHMVSKHQDLTGEYREGKTRALKTNLSQPRPLAGTPDEEGERSGAANDQHDRLICSSDLGTWDSKRRGDNVWTVSGAVAGHHQMLPSSDVDLID